MMKKTKLLFGVHSHQPVDNFDEVLFSAIAKAYKPFFQTLKLFPDFKCSVHFSGWLLEFIKKNDNELFSLMQSLSNQLEFFSGGFYEPILASIPSCDRIAQIQKLNSFIEENFNQIPIGLWLTERVWEDSIISDLCLCGIKYVIVDDYHFIANGIVKNLNGYYLTENNSHKIAIFPINKSLRYSIPFNDIEYIKKQLLSIATLKDGSNGAIIFDDGEKFGVWPQTYDLCYTNGWLKNFFELCTTDTTIETQTYREFFETNRALWLVYLPTLSYEEMGTWSALDEAHSLRGGIWKNFFIKYPQSNWIHKRVLELSKKQINDENYLECLYKAECNDVLWHGVFGGIYLPNLRDTAYRYIIECENILKNKEIEIIDIDFDGHDEYKLSSSELLGIIKPNYGASLVELDIRDKKFNLLNTLTRKAEKYHNQVQSKYQEQNNSEIKTIHSNVFISGTDKQIYADRYRKYSNLDHISDKSLNIENFKTNMFAEHGSFVRSPYESIDEKRAVFKCKGKILQSKAELTKSYMLDKNSLICDTRIKSEVEESMVYANEWNLHFAMYDMLKINNLSLAEDMTFFTKTLSISDSYLKKTLTFDFEDEVDIFICKNYTLSQSESGVDYTLQHLSLMFMRNFTKDLKFSFCFKVQNSLT
ncbi:MAG: 4-alpha-glucanotransferase [Sulfurimonas sp.]|nr:MAG: 4-alpha-glucanotransferase [Sulfurimonas sp.]